MLTRVHNRTAVAQAGIISESQSFFPDLMLAPLNNNAPLKTTVAASIGESEATC